MGCFPALVRTGGLKRVPTLLATVAMAALIAAGVATVETIFIGTVIIIVATAGPVAWVDKKIGASYQESG